MAKIVNYNDFIEPIKALDESVRNIKISSVEIDKAEARITYNFICNNTVGDFLKEKITDIVTNNTPKIFTKVWTNFTKIVSDPELVNNSIYTFLSTNYPSISLFLKSTDVLSTIEDNLVKYTLRLTSDGVEYVTKNNILSRINENLSKKFCSDFSGGTEVKEQEETIDLTSDDVFIGELQRIEYRTIKVLNVIPIDDETMGNVAIYIEDANAGEVTVCGTITDISERMTKSEKPKPFFIIHVDDTTGKTSGLYFSRKSTLDKIRELKVGDAVIMRGSIETREGKKSFKIDKINRCTFPSDFVKKDKYKKTAPKEYKLIFPTPSSTIKIKSVFDEEVALPKELTDNEYVVFDLETTGLDLMSNGITEIGAVKIKDGKIIEQFTTLIKPDYPITDEIVKITGITEEMVKDAPKISTVIPDFMKFIENSVLVAHNAEFDVRFIKRFAGADEYEIKNKVVDSMILAREVLPALRHHDLHTIAEHFEIVFHHHRALADAYATAEAFIEMMKLKNK